MPITTGMPTHTPPDLHGFSVLRSRIRPGFLLSFSVAGLIGLALLAIVVSRILGDAIKTEQLADAASSAELLSAASFGPHVPSVAHFNPGQLNALDQITLAARRTADVSGATIWDLHGRVLYSNDHRTIGAKIEVSPDMSAAASGQTVTAVVKAPTDQGAGQQIDVTTPIYASRGSKPIAVSEIVLPYAPVAEAISARTKRINYILVGAALLFYGLLWPQLLRASKAVRGQTDPRKQALLRQLANAIRRDELLLHYQPTVDLADGHVVAVEALLRWRHPKRGLLAPNEFLPTVTDYALNSQLALHVVEMALRDCEQWRARGIDAAVNVNLSVANVLDPALAEQIGKLLATGGIPPTALGLEITEAAIVADEGKAAVMLKTLDGMGVRIAIDDFGTGYSSLVGLRDLPITEMKIAREFIMGLRMRPRDKAIVRLITRLAHELEVKVIASGVEDEDTVNELAELDVDMAQGHYFSPPLSLADLIAWFDAPIMAGRTQQPGPVPALLTQ
jgi:EAL domain-containing protein (putative c-di-GMP-specific phosphodiesterase class I)